MTSELGIVVSLSRWRATVHYVDCHYYGRSVAHHLPLPRRIKVGLCSVCRPTEEDIRAGTPAVSWYDYSPALLTGVRARQVDTKGDWEHAENIAGRRSLGWGKTPRRAAGWS